METISLYRYKTSAIALACLLSVAAPAIAQTTDAGALQQQLERERQQRQAPARTAPGLVRPAPAPAKAGEGTVSVRQFRFLGNQTLSEAELQAVVARYIGQTLSIAQLQEAAQAVADHYAQQGWLASAGLPRQDITDGIITIKVTEAVLGQIQTQGQSSRINPARVARYVDAQVKPGERISTIALERGLILADELPGVSVSGSLMAGEQEGSTDVIVALTDEPLLVGEISADNQGHRSTSRERANANLVLNSPLGLGDQSSLYIQETRSSDFARLSEALPIGASGLTMGVNASHLSYSILSGMAGAGSKGTSDVVGAELNYPLIRTQSRKLNLSFTGDAKAYDNLTATGATNTHYKSTVFGLGLNGNTLADGSLHTYSATLSSGVLDLNGSPNQAADATTLKTAGTFNKLRFAYALTQPITSGLQFYGSAQGQVADKNLDSSEKFYLGGPTGVRAYPADEGGGTQGLLVNLELRQRLSQTVQGIAFYDYGQVQVAKHTAPSTGTAPNDFALQGAGLGLTWNALPQLYVKTLWSRRIGHNPNPTSTGNDQDGTKQMDRFWLMTSLSF